MGPVRAGIPAFNSAPRCRSRDERSLPGHVADHVSRHFGNIGRAQQVHRREKSIGFDGALQRQRALGLIVDQAQGWRGIQSVLLRLRFLLVYDLGNVFAGQATLQAWRRTRIGDVAGKPAAIALGVQVDPDHCSPEALAAFELANAFDQPRFTAGGGFVLGQWQVVPGQVYVIVGNYPPLQLGQVDAAVGAFQISV